MSVPRVECVRRKVAGHDAKMLKGGQRSASPSHRGALLRWCSLIGARRVGPAHGSRVARHEAALHSPPACSEVRTQLGAGPPPSSQR